MIPAPLIEWSFRASEVQAPTPWHDLPANLWITSSPPAPVDWPSPAGSCRTQQHSFWFLAPPSVACWPISSGLPAQPWVCLQPLHFSPLCPSTAGHWAGPHHEQLWATTHWLFLGLSRQTVSPGMTFKHLQALAHEFFSLVQAAQSGCCSIPQVLRATYLDSGLWLLPSNHTAPRALGKAQRHPQEPAVASLPSAEGGSAPSRRPGTGHLASWLRGCKCP